MKILFELFLAFIILGITEALFKPIARRCVRHKLMKYTPAVLDALDPLMPAMISELDGEDLELVVRSKFEELTEEDWSDVNIEPFWNCYDPRKNADKIEPLEIEEDSDGE